MMPLVHEGCPGLLLTTGHDRSRLEDLNSHGHNSFLRAVSGPSSRGPSWLEKLERLPPSVVSWEEKRKAGNLPSRAHDLSTSCRNSAGLRDTVSIKSHRRPRRAKASRRHRAFSTQGV